MDTESESYDDYYMLLGRFSHHWATMETALATIVTVSHHKYGGKIWLDQELPRTGYGRRVKYLRAAVNIPALKRWRSEIGALLKRTDRLAGDRHLFTHGIPIDFSAPQEINMWFFQINKRGDLIKDGGRKVTWAELTQMGDDAFSCAGQMLNLSEGLIKAVPNQVDETPSKISVQLVRLFPVLQCWRDKLYQLFSPCE